MFQNNGIRVIILTSNEKVFLLLFHLNIFFLRPRLRGVIIPT
jgi:hypothetical protein